MKASLRPLAVAAVALATAVSCASAARETRAGGPADPRLARALDAAIAGDAGRGGLRAEVECHLGDGFRSAVLFEGGVGIWNGGRQFLLTGTQVRDVLEAFRRHRFVGLEETYGGREDPDAALKVMCTAALRVGGAAKRVTQLEQGRQSPELKRLARDVLALCQPPGRAGLSAASLKDGLRRIAAGELAPETLVLSSHHKPEAPDASGEAGWLLQLQGRRMTTRPFTGDEYGPVRALSLPAEDVRAVARVLIEGDFESLPANLDAPGYSDLSVRVLDQQRSVQARRFAGLDPNAQDSARAALDRIHRALGELHRRGLREGQPE